MEIKLKKITVFFCIIFSIGIFSINIYADDNKYITTSEMNSLLNSMMLDMYPVGSIYMSTSATNPSSLFGGGTWVAWGTGKVPVGVDTNNSNFNAVEKTGGATTVSLSASQIASHNHGFTGSAASVANNSTLLSATFSGKNATTSTQTTNHTHYISGITGTAASAGGHAHSGSGSTGIGWAPATRLVFGSGSGVYSNHNTGFNGNWGYADVANTTDFPGGSHWHSISLTTNSAGAHSHSVTTTASTSGGIDTNHSHQYAPSGTVSLANTTHAHSTTFAGTVGYTGSGSSHNNLQPYITCYMWKRTA